MERSWENWDKNNNFRKCHNYWINDTIESNWRNVLAHHLKGFMGDNQQILDVGCGSGLIYEALVQHAVTNPERYLGGDTSKGMLEIAKSRYPEAKFVEMDVFDLKFENRSWDNVINILVMPHLPYYEDAFKELWRVTKNKLVVSLWLTDGEDRIEQNAEGFYNNHYNIQKMKQFLEGMAADAKRIVIRDNLLVFMER
jgi:ubiquinone/menaquinone biosynthesis C-methylase UbiE